ncbi:hypothetical protein QE152_g29855 [Popillia japonica]|uniref:Uncharacterized protein n=1 Tax=Popillia japonica TaxID=7064 RepID=A0AAW1JHH3_POPJA
MSADNVTANTLKVSDKSSTYNGEMAEKTDEEENQNGSESEDDGEGLYNREVPIKVPIEISTHSKSTTVENANT